MTLVPLQQPQPWLQCALINAFTSLGINDPCHYISTSFGIHCMCCHPTTAWFTYYRSMKINNRRIRLKLLTTDNVNTCTSFHQKCFLVKTEKTLKWIKYSIIDITAILKYKKVYSVSVLPSTSLKLHDPRIFQIQDAMISHKMEIYIRWQSSTRFTHHCTQIFIKFHLVYF